MSSIRNAAAGLGMLFAAAVSAVPAAAQPQEKTHQALADLICRKAQEGKKYILFGDSDHSAPEIRQVLASQPVLKAIKECLPGGMLLEGSAENEGAARQKIEIYSMMGRELPPEDPQLHLFKGLMDAGVEFKSLSQGYQRLDNPVDMPALRLLWRAHIPSGAPCSEISMLFHVRANSELTPRAFFERLKVIFNSRHTEDDVPVADHIRARALESGGAVGVLFGEGHMRGSDDLEDLLGQDTAWISLKTARHQGYMRSIGPLFLSSWTPKTGVPDAVYFIKEQDVWSLDTPEAKAAELALSNGGDPMTEAEFNACLADVLPSVREAFAPDGYTLTYTDYLKLVTLTPETPVPPVFKSWLPEGPHQE